MSCARHCDNPDCDGWQRVDSSLPLDWFDVTDHAGGRLLHFCLPDCVLRYFAAYEPTTVISGSAE